MKFFIAGVHVLFLGGWLGCEADQTSTNDVPVKSTTKPLSTASPSQTSHQQSPSSPELQPSAVPAIPSDVRYTIIRSNVIAGIKRSLDVRLNRKVSQEVLRTIATELKKSDHAKYERTFILYYLPGMKVGEGAWAATHFDPDLKIEVLGASVDDERSLATKAASRIGQTMIGKWLDEAWPGGSIITIYRENGRFYIEEHFRDATGTKDEVVEVPSKLGRRFQPKELNDFAEFNVIDQTGNLQRWDRKGFIRTAKKRQ